MDSREPSSLGPFVQPDACGICLGEYTRPKILPCFHTFCFKCLEAYVEKTGRLGRFACPLCLMDTLIPKGGVARFQTNFYIKAEKLKDTFLPNVRCDVCERHDVADSRCLECDQNMCPGCCKTHLKMTASRDHHLIGLLVRDTTPNLRHRVLTRIYCDKHPGDELSFYCRKCDQTICLRCKVTTHENHVSDDLQEVARQTREHLNSKLEGAKLHLPLFHEQLNDINRYDENLTQTKDRLVKTINQRATKLHERVDKLASTLLNDVDAEYNVETARIDNHRSKITLAAKALAGQIHAANQAVMYGADAEIARNKDLLIQQMESIAATAERLKFPKTTLELTPSITLEGKIEESFGNLVSMRPQAGDIKIQEMAVFQVDDTFKVVSSICPVGDGEAWVTSGWKPEIHLFNVYGTRLRTQSVGRNIDTIIQDKSKSLIVTCSDQRQILRSHGNIDFSIIATLGQHPRGIALTDDNELLVCTGQSLAFQDYKEGHKNKVLRYSVDGRLSGEFGEEDQWKFMYPLRIAVNMTGDICVADCQRRCVTIHRRDGTLKAKYTGSETAGLKNSFEPRGLACDARGNIFVTDNANDAIHLLDHSGKFIRLILTSNDEVYGPYATAIDSKGFLWVGARDATVKVFKVSYL